MDNQDEDKQNKNTTQHVLDTTIYQDTKFVKRQIYIYLQSFVVSHASIFHEVHISVKLNVIK